MRDGWRLVLVDVEVECETDEHEALSVDVDDSKLGRRPFAMPTAVSDGLDQFALTSCHVAIYVPTGAQAAPV